jgi:hypothetical protein
VRSIAVALLLAFVACGPDDVGTSATVAVYDLDRIPEDMVAVPYPSDLHRDEAGIIRLGAIPGSVSGPAFDALREIVALRSGFGTSTGAYFAIDGEIDPSSLPPDGIVDAPEALDAVLLVDLENGRLLPTRSRYLETTGLLSVRPAPGRVLHRDRSYAVALTTAIRGADGLPLSASPSFVALRDGVNAGAEVEAARAAVVPAIDAVVDLGVERDTLVALVPFTTGDATRELQRVRTIVRAGGAPTATVDTVFRDDELDALLGIPSEARPGIDVPPDPSTEGTRAIPHASTAFVVTGSFDAPRLLSGSGTDVGVPLRDASGQLEPGPREQVPFTLIVPEGATLDRLPVVLSLHGFNSSRVIGFALADTAGPEGVAVLSIDYYQHGERAASAVDEMHAMRGALEGPDGFAETEPLDVSARVFGVTGVEAGTELSPAYALGSLTQFAADAMSALRFLREGDLDAIRAGVPELASLSFDTDRIYLVGNSLGAEVSTFVLSVEDGIAGAVLNVPPGSVVDNLVQSAEFRPLTETLFLPLLGVRGPFVEPQRGLYFDPVVDLYRHALGSVDPLALAPHLLRDRVAAGQPPALVFQVGAYDEVAAPPATQAMVAAAGISPSRPLTLATGEETVEGPVATFYDGGHGMLEVRHQESRFEAPATPPFRPREMPLPIDNPLAEIHAEIAAVLRGEVR